MPSSANTACGTITLNKREYTPPGLGYKVTFVSPDESTPLNENCVGIELTMGVKFCLRFMSTKVMFVRPTLLVMLIASMT